MFKGSIVALVTPMIETGEIDKKSFCNLIEMHIENGTQAVVVNGTTGESPTIKANEFVDLIKLALDVAKKRIPIIAGTGSNSTDFTIEKTKKAKELGVDACLLVSPYYNRPTQEGLYLHYKKIAENVNLPLILYNVPSRTSCDLLPETVCKLSKIKNIIGVKEATSDVSRVDIFKQGCVDGFEFYSGDDSSSLEFIIKGGHGVISVSANVVPKLFSDMCNCVFEKEYQKAKEINSRLEILNSIMMIEANPIPVKFALSCLGYVEKGIRLPLTWCTMGNQQKIKEELFKLGILK